MCSYVRTIHNGSWLHDTVLYSRKLLRTICYAVFADLLLPQKYCLFPEILFSVVYNAFIGLKIFLRKFHAIFS